MVGGAEPGHQGDLSVAHLGFASLAADLADGLDDMVRADGVRLREKPAVGSTSASVATL